MGEDTAFTVNLSSFILGAVFGALARKSKFCFLRAEKNLLTGKRDNLLSSVLLAMASALVVTQVLSYIFDLDLDSSIYLDTTPSFFMLILGAVLFSFGMVLSNACPNRHLILAGGGNIRSVLVILVMGTFSYMTVRGLLAEPRLFLTEYSQNTLPQASIDGFVAASLGIGEAIATALVIVFILVLLLFCAWKYRAPKSTFHYITAIALGGSVGLGWLITGYIGFDEFDPAPLQSLTFTVPPGEMLVYLMTYTGSTLTFSIAMVFGVLTGSLVFAVVTRDFHWQTYESVHQTHRSLLGAAFMGVGAVLASGCTIGQGLSGFSTLSIASLVVASVIFISSGIMIKLKL